MLVRLRHQHVDIPPDDFANGVSKDPLCRQIQRLHDAFFINGDIIPSIADSTIERVRSSLLRSMAIISRFFLCKALSLSLLDSVGWPISLAKR